MGYTTFENNGQPAINDTNLNLMQVELMKMVFPIGATYITQTNQNPSEILKFGTWERLKGKVCLGLDENDADFNTIGKTGGDKEHILTPNELPSVVVAGPYNTAGEGWTLGDGGTPQIYTNGNTTIGLNHPHNNMPPYEIVGYMWIRRS